ncbi:putative rRNA 2'-O-methyltransferase fibrillarin 3 [Apium graveolens]|uniref:putative rRNA 2'-O-methyltransferase fibrillarin 3 n=1 Tax=Apium graveolens TaxID=4045 RepID=UPI003D7A3EBF
MKKFEAVEEYLNRTDQIFELKSFLPFLSDDEALDQMNVISNSTITDKLKEFLKDYFPTPTHCDTVGTCDAVMGGIMSSSMCWLLFQSLYTQNEEDRTEIEYRVWDPLRSKLAPAIHFGVTNIWIKPGSHVLYMGNVCGLAVSDLSDLVGLDGLVYVVGFSDDDVADMAGRRPNVLTINMKGYCHVHYRMLVGMVDVIFAEIDHHPEICCPHNMMSNIIFCTFSY